LHGYQPEVRVIFGMKTDNTLRRYVLVSTLIGLVDSLYLTWIKLSHREALCLPGIGDCETVNSSRYSAVFGIPIALLGALAYLAIIALVLLEDRQVLSLPIGKEFSKMAVFGLSLVGVLYSVYLTYIEIAVLHAICPYCVISALAILAVFVLSLARLVNNQE
jgi:uncharacterized membrane protein